MKKKGIYLYIKPFEYSSYGILSSDNLYNETNISLYYYNYTYGSCEACPLHCKTCAEKIDDEYSYYCFSCIEGYNLINYECSDYQCSAGGSGHFCLTCDKNEKFKCASCNSGYYLNKTSGTCKKCIDNCAKCNDSNICLECNDNYELYFNRCAIGCIKGSDEKPRSYS